MAAESPNVVVDLHNTSIYPLDESLEGNDAWVERLKKRVAETKLDDPHCIIFRVQHKLRMADPAAYEPRILSLGPYHHGKPRLKAMEKLKWRYLKLFLDENYERGLEDYIKLVAGIEAKTREAYSDAPQINSKRWVEMMLLDGCFVIEFLYKGTVPIKNSSYTYSDVLSDMLLVENQLPLFLLKELCELNSLHNVNSCFLPMIRSEFIRLMPGNMRVPPFLTTGGIHHILHLLYFFVLPNNPTTEECSSHGLRRRLWSFCIDPLLRKFTRKTSISSTSDGPPEFEQIPSAKKLKDAGVAFRKKTNPTSFIDITFRRGTLEIPRLQISGRFDSLYRNLLAFEQNCMRFGLPMPLSAYTYTMDCIINTSADVDLLRQEGIIVSSLGNDDDVAQLFNQLGKNISLYKNSYLDDVFEGIQCHCNQRVNKWKALLNHNYFSNPWAIFSVIAAIVLFLLTITQTVFTALSYVKPHSA